MTLQKNAEGNINLQDAVIELDARLSALEGLEPRMTTLEGEFSGVKEALSPKVEHGTNQEG